MLDGLPDDTGAGTHPVQVLVSSVGSASVEAMDAALWGFSDEQIATLVVEHARSARQFDALGLTLVRQADRCDAGKALGAVSTPDWLRDALRLLPGEAKGRVVLAAGLDVDAAALYCAEQVLTQHDADSASSPRHAGYPVPSTEQVQGTTTRVGESDAAGVRRSPLALDADAVEALAVWAGRLPCTAAGLRGLDPVTVADAEACLATQALQVDPRSLGRIGSHLVITLTPQETVSDEHDDDAGEDVLSSDAKRREHAEAQTFFALTDQGDGTVRAAGCFSEEAADSIRTALEPLAAPQPAIDGTPDPRPYGKRQGDALVELSRRSLDAGSLPSTRGARPHVSITVTTDDLLATPGAAGGQSMWATPVPPDVLRRICCDATVTRVITDPLGLPLHTDSGTRTVTPKQWTALMVRDRGCTFPGCARPAAWCHGLVGEGRRRMSMNPDVRVGSAWASCR